MCYLKPVTGGNGYSGPSVLSSITGVSSDAIESFACKALGRDSIDVIHLEEVETLLRKLKMPFRTLFDDRKAPRMPFARWMQRARDRIQIIWIDGRLVAAHDGLCVDFGWWMVRGGEPVHWTKLDDPDAGDIGRKQVRHSIGIEARPWFRDSAVRRVFKQGRDKS